MRRSLHSLRLWIGLCLVFFAPSVHADAVEDAFVAALGRKQSHQLDEAALSFKTIALEHPEHPIAERAMGEYFEILKPTFEAPGYAGIDEANDVTALFVEGFCKRSTNRNACEQVEAIHCSVMRLGAERRIRDHSGTSESDRAIVKQAGDMYLGIWKRYGTNARAKRVCRMDEVLFNAAHAYRHGADLNAAAATYEILVDPQNGFLDSPLGHRALYELGQWHTQVAAFPEAIARFDQFMTLAPKDERARDALYNAMVLRLQTGRVQEALKNAETFLAGAGPTRKDEATTMILEVGETLIVRGEYEQAETWMKKTMPRVKQDGVFEHKVFAAGLLGRALAETGDEKGASEQYRGIFGSASSGGWLRSAPKEANSAWAWKVLDVVVDAAVFLIRVEGTDARRIPVSKNIKAMQEAIDLRAEVIERTVVRYAKPLEDSSNLPAKGKLGISVAIAGLWIDMAEEIDRGIEAMKKAKATPADVRAVEKAAEGALDRADRHARVCLQQANEQQQWSNATKRCRNWLERRYPKEFPTIEEFAPGFRAPLESAILRENASLANP